MQHPVCQVGRALIFKAMPPPGPAETTRRAKSDGSTEGQAVEMRQDPPEVVHSGLEETALHRGVVLRAVRSSKPPKRPLLGLQQLRYAFITEAKKQPLKIPGPRAKSTSQEKNSAVPLGLRSGHPKGHLNHLTLDTAPGPGH